MSKSAILKRAPDLDCGLVLTALPPLHDELHSDHNRKPITEICGRGLRLRCRSLAHAGTRNRVTLRSALNPNFGAAALIASAIKLGARCP